MNIHSIYHKLKQMKFNLFLLGAIVVNLYSPQLYGFLSSMFVMFAVSYVATLCLINCWWGNHIMIMADKELNSRIYRTDLINRFKNLDIPVQLDIDIDSYIDRAVNDFIEYSDSWLGFVPIQLISSDTHFELIVKSILHDTNNDQLIDTPNRLIHIDCDTYGKFKLIKIYKLREIAEKGVMYAIQIDINSQNRFYVFMEYVGTCAIQEICENDINNSITCDLGIGKTFGSNIGFEDLCMYDRYPFGGAIRIN